MAFLEPKNVLGKLIVKEDFIAADFGCGSGGWVLPLAKILENGKVYAIDLLEEPLSALRSRMKSFKISNIEPIKADVERSSKLFNNSCDLVLMTNLLFQVDDISRVLEEAKRVLKPRGQVLVVDWQKEASLGPKDKVSIEEIKKIAREIDFKLEKEFEAGVYHWALVLVKPR